MGTASTKKTARRRAKRIPEFDLPPIILAGITDYLGTRAMNKLTPAQRSKVVEIANTTSAAVAVVINNS